MRAIYYLRKWQIIDWELILLGLEKGWAIKEDAIDWAVNILAETDAPEIALIAGGESLSISELKDLIEVYITKQKGHITLGNLNKDKWRLAHLKSLLDQEIDEEEKINKLQELYAIFDYPEDMTSCSIYSQDEISPLNALQEVVDGLAKKYLPADMQTEFLVL